MPGCTDEHPQRDHQNNEGGKLPVYLLPRPNIFKPFIHIERMNASKPQRNHLKQEANEHTANQIEPAVIGYNFS